MSEHRLNEILIERPRGGMRVKAPKGEKKRLTQLTEEASTDGLLSPYLHKRRDRTKYFSDHLSPLRRWLRSKVGQSWDSVYSELSQRLSKNTITGQHVLSHLWDYVERHVVVVDGIPYPKNRRWYPLVSYRNNRFYVHPETGLLCLAPPSKQVVSKPQRKDELDSLVVDQYHSYQKLNGIWYLVTYKDLKPAQQRFDIVLKTELNSDRAQRRYGRPIYAVYKQQCGKKELKRIRQQLE